MIKLVIFDLDGVLVDTKLAHYEALNKALVDFAYEPISYEDHLHRFDGLPTFQKLKILDIPFHDFDAINRRKQAYTLKLLGDCAVNPDWKLFPRLAEDIAVVTNSSKHTVKYYQNTFWGENVPFYYPRMYMFEEEELPLRPKPSAHMFMLCMIEHGVEPYETLIIEDSPKGLEGAYASGAHVLSVKDIYDASYPKLQNFVDKINIASKTKKSRIDFLDAPDMNVLIPMAGAGSRFSEAGYTFPKPLIEVNGKPMIQLVVENIGVKAQYTFIVQKEHYDRYNLGSMLSLVAPGCNIVPIDGVTEGAACTALLAKEYIDSWKPLLIANSDQYVEWNITDFLYKARHYDGGLVTFNATHPKWSFVKVEDGYVVEVAEKNPISDIATAGIYFYQRGKDFVRYAEQMIEKNIRTNNEFYIAPVFNEAIADGKKIVPFMIDQMWGLGTPEDLRYFLDHHEK